MNFLAHAFLSGDDPQIRIGNLIADSVKGSAWKNYPEKIQVGIQLHRFIDDYTDHHPVVDEIKILLRPRFGKYAGVVSDVYFDHYLARLWEEHHPALSLREFADETYSILDLHFDSLPEKSRLFIPYMIRQDWLGSYVTREGISSILERMSRRTGFYSGMELALEDLEENDHHYETYFRRFFPDLNLQSDLHRQRLQQDFGL